MTRIVVQRGSASSSSSSQNRLTTLVTLPGPSSSSASPVQQVAGISAVKDANLVEELQEQTAGDDLSEHCSAIESMKKEENFEDSSSGCWKIDRHEDEKTVEVEKLMNPDDMGSGKLVKAFEGWTVVEEEGDAIAGSSYQVGPGSSHPPPPPVPPPKPSISTATHKAASNDSNGLQIGSSKRAAAWSSVSNRSSPTGSHPSSPRSHGEGEGYNSADEQNSCFNSSYDDAEKEHQFVTDLRRVKGLEVRKMLEDGNCLFRAVADQVYGDSQLYDLVRQMCIDYMERERDHFSQFITEGFTSYCKRKRRDKVYGNNVEIQALSEIYNRPIHIYSYSTEPINIFHGSYNTDTPPIRLSYHHGNHYNSLVDPRRQTTGVGLGFSSLQGRNVDKDQVKAAIKAQQDQQIDNALLAEGRFYSDLELTEKEIEHMVMEASREEYLAGNKFKQQRSHRDSSTSMAEPSSSAARSAGRDGRQEGGDESGLRGLVLNSSMQIMLSMGFSYLQVIEAYSIFGDDVDSMVCYLIEKSTRARRKGKATE